MSTDETGLQQVLKNLRSNAFKFTERCKVILEVTVAREGWSREHDVLNRADAVIALSVHDTGIGIAPDKQQIIVEAFQQSTSRKYGGTGLDRGERRRVRALPRGRRAGARLQGGRRAPRRGGALADAGAPAVGDHAGHQTSTGGASSTDYLSKPVDTEQLLALLRLWLHR
ncbi:ATP-binding protein [Sorangium sp. So ce1036]|uniref:ATP-binding protein n=1 Tax=Sorangium sp. So ce1036 TaxID=3133328 RepID=UPI003F045BF4